MATNEQLYLLKQHGIIQLFGDIDLPMLDHFMYLYRLGRQHNPHEPIALHIASDGGDTSCAGAIMGEISLDGNIDGVLMGDCSSSSGWIWAACKRRYVYPYATLGLHPITWVLAERHRNARILELHRVEWEAMDKGVAQLYADVSNMPAEFWSKEIARGEGHVVVIPSHELVGSYEMAEWYKERSAVWTPIQS